MASKKWDKAVEELKKKKEEILAFEEKEAAVISLANATTEFVFYDKPASVKIPKDQANIEINDDYWVTLSGKEVDIPLFKKFLNEAGFYADITKENNKAIILEVSVKRESSKENASKAVTKEEQGS